MLLETMELERLYSLFPLDAADGTIVMKGLLQYGTWEPDACTKYSAVPRTTPPPKPVLVIPCAVCARHASHRSLFGTVQYRTVLGALDSAVDPMSASLGMGIS